ncbi:MAG TPA: VOC family protein [Streptosporangiaceae bacterium]
MARISLVTLVVADYDEAIRFYTEAAGFTLTEDTPLGNGNRWVVVTPPGGQAGLLLATAATEAQRDRVGDQTGGRVSLFLHSDDFSRDYERMRGAGVRFAELPRHEPYGTVAVFEDLYGNRWDLIELASPSATAAGQAADS